MDDLARFQSRVHRTPSCWLWTGKLNGSGYGRIRVQGSVMLAHRAAYIFEHGGIHAGDEIDHACHTRSCVNPSHLRAVSHRENQQNRAGARRDSGTGVRGVYRNNRTGRYSAYAVHRGVTHRAGTFDTLDAADAAARNLRNQIHVNNLMDRATA